MVGQYRNHHNTTPPKCNDGNTLYVLAVDPRAEGLLSDSDSYSSIEDWALLLRRHWRRCGGDCQGSEKSSSAVTDEGRSAAGCVYFGIVSWVADRSILITRRGFHESPYASSRSRLGRING
ncbi:unnamed protein product [Boreogadus saida]